MKSTIAGAQRIVLCTAVTATGVVFLPSTNDPVNVPKLSVLLLCAIVVLALASMQVIQTRRVEIPSSPAGAAAAVLCVAFVSSAAVAQDTTTAIVGAYGRNSGLLAYLAALVLFLAALYLFDAKHVSALLVAMVLAGGFTAAYGLLQQLGLDAVRWNNPFNPVIASLGNPDFASAYMGIAAPAAACGALRAIWPLTVRAACALTTLACLAVAAVSSAVQGPLAGGAGLLVLALSVSLGLRRRRRALAIVTGLALAGIGVLTAGLAGVGPAHKIFTRVSFQARTWYWQAALTMWHQQPFVGVGLDEYGLYWRRSRPVAAPRVRGGDTYSDSAHSVPLQHLAQGGLILAAAYLCFVLVVAWALVSGLRCLAGDARLVLGGTGGAWVAYQVQSVVSIDQVPLLLVNFALGGAVVAVAGHARIRTWPPATAHIPSGARKRRRVKMPARRPVTSKDRALQGTVVLAALVAAWLCLIPLRANAAARMGDLELHASNGDAALRDYRQATSLMPGEGVYWTLTGELYQLANKPASARAAFEVAFGRDGTQVNALRAAGQIAETLGDVAGARRDYTTALAMDPTNEIAILSWTNFEMLHGDATAARDRLQGAVRDLPGDPALWAALGDARTALSDGAGARKAYQTALRLKPGEPQATAGLHKLDTAL